MNVLQVPRRFVREEWGGTETVVLETSRRLLQLGHRTEILCPRALAACDRETMSGVPVRRVPYFYPYFGLSEEARAQMDRKGGNMFSLALLREMTGCPDLDLVHLHTQKRIGGIGRYAARLRGIPYVVSLHGGVFDVPASEAATWTEPTRGAVEWGRALGLWVGSNRVLADAAAILCVGKAEERQIQERYPDRNVVFLPNGVDTARFASGDGAGFRARHGIPRDATVVLTVGRIDVQKNQRLAIRALPAMLADDPRAHLLLVGHVTSPAYRELVERDVREAGLERHVTLIPGLDAATGDLPDAYHAADLFLLPSTHEPFGIVILEAWAAGLPVIASRVGGVPSFVEDGVDALLFEPDDACGLVERFRVLRADAGLRARVASAGQHKAAHSYDWDIITRRLVGIYEDALRPGAPRPL